MQALPNAFIPLGGHALTLALALTFWGGMPLSLPLAQAAEPAASLNLHLAAQPLERMLTQLADQANVRLIFNSNDLGDLPGRALEGEYTLAQALDRLLQGSGYTWRLLDGQTLVLEKLPTSGAAIALDALTVTGRDSPRLGATTENSGSYTTGSTNTATKLHLSLRETPQSVSVVTRQRMDDQGMNDLNDVVKYAPGIILRKHGGDRQEFLARGFTIDNIMYDGLPTSISSFTLDTISGADLAMYDRVEVVRGATGLMSGAGSPSATLNLVRKRSTETPQASMTFSAGSWDRYRTEVDASNRLNQAGTLRGRAVAAYEDNKSYIDVREKQRQTFYGVLEADLSDSTTWTIGASKQRDDATSDWGSLPSGPNGEDLHLSRSTFLSNDWAYWDRDNISLFTDLTTHFDNGWTSKLAMARVWAESKTFSSYLNAPIDGEYTQSAGQYDTTDVQTNLDGSLSGPFQWFGREHELTVGASRRQEKFDQKGGFWSAGVPVDIHNFDPGVNGKPAAADRQPYESRSTATEKGIYAAVRLNPVDPLHLIIGSRLSWYDYDDRSGAGDYKVTREFTPYAGIVYDLNDTYSVYASYTEIFKPQNQQDVAGSVLDPMTGESYEIGLKGEYFDGELNASVALFDMTQENRAYVIADQPGSCRATNRTCYEAAGEVRSRGIDTEISGALTPYWQASAAYTLVLSQYVKDATYKKGNLFAPNQPKHLFKAATTYYLPGYQEKLRIGADVLAQSATYGRVGTGHAEQDAYAVVGLMAGYRLDEHWDARVNLNNVFDEKYWQGIPTASGSGTYGDPRNLMFSLKWSL